MLLRQFSQAVFLSLRRCLITGYIYRVTGCMRDMIIKAWNFLCNQFKKLHKSNEDLSENIVIIIAKCDKTVAHTSTPSEWPLFSKGGSYDHFSLRTVNLPAETLPIYFITLHKILASDYLKYLEREFNPENPRSTSHLYMPSQGLLILAFSPIVKLLTKKNNKIILKICMLFLRYYFLPYARLLIHNQSSLSYLLLNFWKVIEKSCMSLQIT